MAVTKQVHAFVAEHPDFANAVTEAVGMANVFLRSHQWMDTDGRSVYAFVPYSSFDGKLYTYVLHVIGPEEETP